VPLLHMKPATGLILGVENTSSPTDLDLYFNQLQGISRSFQQMCRLRSFDLQFNNLNGWLSRLVFAPPSCMGCLGSFKTCITVKKTHCNFCEENTLILYIRVNLFFIQLINGMHALVLNK
jgi:hypothetical protein